MKPYFLKKSPKAEFKTGEPVLYAFDFDGTLTPIVRRPTQVRLSRQTQALLRKLARKAPVAIITGRSVTDLKKRLGLKIPYLIGNHGLEGCVADRELLVRAERNCKAWKRQILAQGLDEGIEVEDKRYSLSVHYRMCRSKAKAKRNLQKILDALKPAPRIVGGKDVFNLVQPHAPHKGDALLKLMKKLKTHSAFYAGDDVTDEDVFNLKRKHLLTVRVGKKASSHARYYIPRQSEINKLLRTLIDSLAD